MRGVMAAGAVGIGLIAGSGAAIASHNDGGGGKREFAVGAGRAAFALGVVGETGFTFSAHSDPFGGRPTGYVTATGDPDGPGPIASFTVRGHVTCVRVDGNRASLKWRFEEATGSAAPFEGGGAESFVEDNGEPRLGEPVDRAATDGPQPAETFDPQAEQCEDPDTRPTYARIEEGNLTVHAAAGR